MNYTFFLPETIGDYGGQNWRRREKHEVDKATQSNEVKTSRFGDAYRVSSLFLPAHTVAAVVLSNLP